MNNRENSKKENKIVPLTSPELPTIEEYMEELKAIWDFRYLTNNGIKAQTLITEIKKYLNVKNASLFINGHIALEIALQTLQVSGEAITTPFTFLSTSNAIARMGLKPVFCDVEPDYYNIDPEKIEALITEKTSVIIPVHVYGSVCDVVSIERVAKKYNLKIIYDAAHAFGCTLNGKGVGTFGDISMFSLHATKIFHSAEGGVLTYANNEYKECAERLRNFGICESGDAEEIGTNAKMNELSAAMGLCVLKKLDKSISKRKDASNRYRKFLSDIKGIKLLKPQKDVEYNYSYFPIFIDSNEFGKTSQEMHENLGKDGILTRKYFYPTVNKMTAYKESIGLTPIANNAASQVLCLPMNSSLTTDDVDYICNSLLKYRK